MSDLGAIFHVKKDGVQYDAHAYTTLDECPEPNLKINFKGTQAYVKLMDKGKGNVPCYVKPKSASMIYQVQKEASIIPPTGHTSIQDVGSFTVPPGVTVIEISGEFPITYVGVTPNTTHTISIDLDEVRENVFRVTVECRSHNIIYARDISKINEGDDLSYLTLISISWSPEINKQPTDVKDY